MNRWTKYGICLQWKEILTQASIRMNLENIVLSEKSQTEKTTYSMLLFIQNAQNRKIHNERKLVVVKGWVRRNQ